MKLEIALLAGAESKEFLVKLTKQIDRLESICAHGLKKNNDVDTETEEEDEDDDFAKVWKVIRTETEEEDEDDDFAKKPGKKAKGKSFDEDEETEESEEEAESDDDDVSEEESDDEETEVPVKKAKVKKLAIDDCNDAAKACALSIGGKPGRTKVLTLMKKHFKTESVSELKPEQYVKFIQLMQENTKE